jgi:hypothetical protein
MAFTLGLSDTERFRAVGYIQAFIAAMPRFKQDGDQITYLEAMDDTMPELRVIRRNVSTTVITPENTIGCASIIETQSNDYRVFSTGVLVGCNLLSDAVQRVQKEIFGEVVIK